MFWELSHASWRARTRQGRFVNDNFDSYRLMRMQETPEVEVHFAMSGRLVGRHRRAGRSAGPACRRQRDLVRHRQADPLDTDHEARPQLELTLRHYGRPQRLPAPAPRAAQWHSNWHVTEGNLDFETGRCRENSLCKYQTNMLEV